MRHTYDKQHLPFGNSSAILDTNVLDFLNTLSINLPHTLSNKDISDEFCKSYFHWIESSTLNYFKGLDKFPYKCYSNGTTEAFDKFYMKNSTRRFRCFSGEYMYHRLAWRNYYPNWKLIEEDILDINDAVVISLPFSDTGGIHQSYEEVLKTCDRLGIPVLIDCAYFGICSNINFDLTFDCITDVVFSLSKTFPIAHARIGMRLSKVDNDDSLFVVNKSKYTNRIGAFIGLNLVEKFSADYIPSTYTNTQSKICDHLKVKKSNTVLFGLGNKQWDEYNRGTTTNRLSFHKYIHLPLSKFYEEFKSN
jgi:hypothetical protein